MLEFICLFFPPVLGLALMEHLLKRKFSNKGLLILYVWLCLSSNFIVFVLKRLAFQTSTAPFFNISVDAALHYIPMAFLATCLMTYFTTLFFKKTELSFETKEDKADSSKETDTKKTEADKTDE